MDDHAGATGLAPVDADGEDHRRRSDERAIPLARRHGLHRQRQDVFSVKRIGQDRKFLTEYPPPARAYRYYMGEDFTATRLERENTIDETTELVIYEDPVPTGRYVVGWTPRSAATRTRTTMPSRFTDASRIDWSKLPSTPPAIVIPIRLPGHWHIYVVSTGMSGSIWRSRVLATQWWENSSTSGSLSTLGSYTVTRERTTANSKMC